METIFTDIPRAYTALAEWFACMVYLLCLERRVRGRKFWMISVLALIFLVIFLVATDDLPLALWIPCMMTAVAMMYGFLMLEGRLTLLRAGYCCAGAFLLAEFAASLEWQLNTYLVLMGFDRWWQQVLLLVIIYGVVFGTAFRLERSIITQEYLNQLTVKELTVSVGTVIVVFAFSNMSFVMTNSPFTSKILPDIFNIRTLVDLGGLAVLYAFQSRISEYLAEKEISAIQTVLKSQYEQYRNFQESIEMVHIKYHDLKHQIEGLRAEKDMKKRTEWLDALEQELETAEFVNKTGNYVLDTILEAKIFLAKKDKIRMTCVIDGTLLNFMHVRDICTIFGNALDNAIECVAGIEDMEKRMIHMSVTAQKKFVLIQIENYCEQDPKFEEGKFPQTTKTDKGNHGFGLKSIQYTVEKYGGSMQVGMENHWFGLRILFPVEQDK